jgi:two-component system sensor histidine kinase EvgS
MDIIMPVMDGIEAAEKIKNNPKFKTLPIIAISASVQGEFSKSWNDKNFDAYIPKPFLLPQFFEMIKNHLKIEWTYNEITEENKIMNTELILPDDEILEKIIYSAEKGDFSSINIILEELENNSDFNQFLQTIHNFVKNYDEDSIVKFIKNNRL